ncbi:MAG: hypothetical protein ACI8QD_002781 [Cyclobacteriaceae bacterium]|jgi:hypothetical protein
MVAEPWISLFDSASLSGWKILNGTATYNNDNGVITGITQLGTPNTFLTTERDYSDFILAFDVLVDSTINSGVQFRSNSLPDYREGTVHGYQCEIDPSPRAWSGGIYDESRRGWLYDMDNNPQAKPAFKNGQWNAYRIEAIGDTLRTWINHINTANLIDRVTGSGFIALQVHSISDSAQADRKIHWRNVRILENNLQDYRWSDKITAPLLTSE